MQTAYQEARETAKVPVQSLLTEPGHSVVLWTPETLDLSRKQVGLLKIEGRNFAVFYDQRILDRDQSETIFNDQTGAPRQLTYYTKTATACAVEVLIQFGARGVVILDSLLDRPQAALVQFEAKLVNAGWFDREKNPRLDDLTRIINQLTAAGAWSDEKEEQAANDLLTAIATAINHRATYADDLMGEAQRAREGKQGRANLTRAEQAYLAEIGFQIPTDVAALDVKKAAAVAAPGVQPEVVELMQANTQAIVSVFSDALQKLADAQQRQAEFFMQALNEVRGQSGPTGPSQQPTSAGATDGAGTIAGQSTPIAQGHSGLSNQPRPDDAGGVKAGDGSLESAPGNDGDEIDSIIADAGRRVTSAANRGNKTTGGKPGSKPGNKA